MAHKHQSKEQVYIDDLIEHLEQNNEYISYDRNVEYGNRSACGELDVIAHREDGYVDIYEVKATSKGLKKAKDQLRRARRHYNRVMHTYVYIGQDKEVIPYYES